MDQKKFNLFLHDVEKLHNKVTDSHIKAMLNEEFKNIKESYIIKKKENKINIYEEVEKKLKTSLGEATTNIISINIEEYRSPCEDHVLVERLKYINEKIKYISNDPLIYSTLKGFLLFRKKESMGPSLFIKFLDDVGESYDYVLFLIKLYKLFDKYKRLCRCRLPVGFFKKHYPLIKQICKNNSDEWLLSH